ncbi:MAG: hypothetical protein PHH35_02795 [Candidatus Pacebacteria bacterium]|jgi:hypothetical protein|nr:hypothetical protein [Candidatus Paceibacterota bacterium]
MVNNILKKKSKKELLFFSISLIIIFTSGLLIFFSLTFLIKNINLVLQTLTRNDSDLHFNINDAKQLFPSLEISN